MHISHGENGMVAPPGDTDAYIDAARALVRDPAQLDRIRTNARAYVETVDWDSTVCRLEQLLLSAVVKN